MFWSLTMILSGIVFAHQPTLTAAAKETFSVCITAVEDRAYFLKEFFAKYQTVGAIAPSSERLAQAITQTVTDDSNASPRRILEVGAGTGVFTEALLKKLHDNDVLVAIEYVPSFVSMLEKKFAQEIKHGKLILIQGDVLMFNPNELFGNEFRGFNHIVSGLPFNSFSPTFVASVLEKYQQWISVGGSINYFEYAALPSIKDAVFSAMQKVTKSTTAEEFKALREILETFIATAPRGNKKKLVLLNIPPAYAITCYY